MVSQHALQVSPGSGGFSNFSGGVSPIFQMGGGFSNFSEGGVSNFSGGSSNFLLRYIYLNNEPAQSWRNVHDSCTNTM